MHIGGRLTLSCHAADVFHPMRWCFWLGSGVQCACVMGNGTGGFGRVRAGASGGISFTARIRGLGGEMKIIGGLICRTRIGDLAVIW
jgi:hypothetical protein